MHAIVRTMLDLCLLRGGPQDLPHAAALANLVVVVLAALKLATAFTLDLPQPMLRSLASIGLLLALPWLVLLLRGRPARYLQTLTALAGVSLLFSLLFVPVLIAASGMPPVTVDHPPSTPQLVLGWMSLLLLGWKLLVTGHVYHHALDWPRLPALLLALALFLIEFGVFRALFADG